MKKFICLVLSLCCLFLLCACGNETDMSVNVKNNLKKMPKAEANLDSMFGVDKNITVENIDEYLNRPDTVYRDMRMLFDPADYAAIGGDADLSFSIKGFKVVPYPYIATLQTLPVEGAYTGECLFTVKWNEDGTAGEIKANYKESMLALEELFPKDKNIIFTCGGGGYSGMMRAILIKLGWDETKLYNIGGSWEYKGENRFEIISYPEDAKEDPVMATWRADYAYIEFAKLHPVTDTEVSK
ncbi:MAG: hypothetical protein GX241_04430 [Ruminococcaceae bacterium]|nr:hypothetical protein [Oscillospiraceae bacterium]